MEDIYSQEPKFCRCTQSSVAHVRGCYEGWGSSPEKSQKDTPPMTTPEKELCEVKIGGKEGFVALVDKADVPLVSAFNWSIRLCNSFSIKMIVGT